jgi:hypothetical protein
VAIDCPAAPDELRTGLAPLVMICGPVVNGVCIEVIKPLATWALA